MGSDDEEMVAALLEEKVDDVAAAAADDEHMEILSTLLAMYILDLKPRRGGSRPRRRKSKPRQRLEGYCMMYADYFVDDPLHGEVTFRRRFRMNRKLFMQIVMAVREYDTYFVCEKDCVGTIDFSSIQKCTLALRMHVYGAHADTQDDYMRMANSTAHDCMYRFCRAVVAVFGELYLRSSTPEDIARIMAQNGLRESVTYDAK